MTVPFLTDPKSTVTPKGVPNSSFLAYRFPIEAFESSTRFAIPAFRNLSATEQTAPQEKSIQDQSGLLSFTIYEDDGHMVLMMGLKTSLPLRGTINTLIGAIEGGSDSTYLIVCVCFEFKSCRETLHPQTKIDHTDQLLQSSVVGFRSWITYASVDILFSSPKGMFKQRVKDPSDPKRRFNHVRGKFSCYHPLHQY